MTVGKAGGQIISGVASYESGKYTKKVLLANAKNAEADTQMQIARLRDQARLSIGQQFQSFGGGLTFDGSALDAVRESGIESNLEIMQTRRSGILAARSLRAQSKVAFAQGYNGMIQQFAGAAATVASAAAGGADGGGFGAAGGADYASAGGPDYAGASGALDASLQRNFPYYRDL